jgi:hypothetical protein
VLTALPDRERQAIEIVERHLGAEAQPEPPLEEQRQNRQSKQPRQIKAVK